MKIKWVLFFLVLAALAACGYRLVPAENVPADDWQDGRGPGMGGTFWMPGSFDSNGEQIYFTGVDQDGQRIGYTGGPFPGMMMDSSLSCASCHGTDARGGLHTMHMQTMDAPDIRWEALLHDEDEEHEGDDHGEYDFEAFKMAVVEGKHPNGEELDDDMPRWQISDEDLADLAEYLMSLP
jgi:cytochrome c oxidase subunit 2